MKYILGIDIGTTNTKAVAYSHSGIVMAQANNSYSYISEQQGCHEQDPNVLFVAVLEVIRAVLQLTSSHELTGISFSSAMHGLMAVDDKCHPLTNLMTWADLRSNQYALGLKNTALGSKLYERTGTPAHPMSPLCKLMWMRDHWTSIFQNAYKFISIKEYIYYHFFDEYIVDRSIASSTGLFDIYNLDWNADALSTAGITTEKLSRHVNTTFTIKGLNDNYAAMFGIDRQTPFVIGASDGCLAHIGSNALEKGDVSLTIGTSGAVRMMTEMPVHDPRQRIFNYLLTDKWYVSGGAVNNGGNVLQWFAKGFLKNEIVSPDEFESFVSEACGVPAGSEGLIFLPYINGERATVWDADARGIFFGVSSIHTRAHFMRAIMEGISFALYEILHSMEETIGGVNSIYAGGGFIRSKQWVMLLADVLGKKISVTHAEDSSVAGAAILGLQALGIIEDWQQVKSFFTVKESFEPDMANHQTYMRNYSVYSNLYEKFKEIKS